MDTQNYQRLQEQLAEKERSITDWLESSPPPKRRVYLGPNDTADVELHLRTIDTAIEKAGNQTIGICEICHEQVETKLLEMDYTSCICLDHFSEEEKRQLEMELELSREVQRAFLPHALPSIPGLELYAYSRPAQIIGGDYYDFFTFKNGAPGFAVADAMGHGVSASLLTTSLQSVLRAFVPENVSPADVLQRANHFHLHNINYTTFATVFLSHIDPTTMILTYANAGHNPPILFKRQTQQVEWLMPTAAAIGLVEEYEPQTNSLQLDQGDILLIYTDGVTEATNPQGQPFGAEQLAQQVIMGQELSAAELLQAVRNTLQQFIDQQPLADDTTMLAIRYTG